MLLEFIFFNVWDILCPVKAKACESSSPSESSAW